MDYRLRQLRYAAIYDHLDSGMYLSYAIIGRVTGNQKAGLNFKEIPGKWQILLERKTPYAEKSM